jgi:ATP-dependent RNA helicase DDX5/DBP2
LLILNDDLKFSKEADGPIGLVLVPTRELANQIEKHALQFLPKSLRVLSCFGGSPRGSQRAGLRKGCELVISTPGRLIDFIETGATNLFRVSFLVLDEADRMLDMGFEPQIRTIISQIRPDRQTLMLSATWPKEVQSLAREFIKNPIHLQVGDSEISVNKDIEQIVEVIEEKEKWER